ncbi:MAG: hypothetical protein JWP69_1661 [Flaviaesturariibacter sp.]|nr:hypothetical protein [Flaviaesturariibacter sp.]
MNLQLHPSVGVSRLGNSPDQICLSPDAIGGLPYEGDANGNSLGPIVSFKDGTGLIKRQGQPFKVYDGGGNELTLQSPNVQSITWTVHLANKKAAWYQYNELQGNLLYGEGNSYSSQAIPLRNLSVQNRQTLIVDPGPRTISGAEQYIGFDVASAPAGYPVQYPPSTVLYGTPVNTLGNLITDSAGRLIVLGGYGNAGGNEPLTSYGGSDSWHDDISDGPVYCSITFNDGTPEAFLSAWVIVGSPDFAPEIVNISNLSDTFFDVAVRHFDLVDQMYSNGSWNTGFVANYQRDILPIINRICRYQWVANVQSMMAFASHIFDFTDPSPANSANRQTYFSYFRQPDSIPESLPPDEQPQQVLFQESSEGYFPMMPLNSASNSVSNVNVLKFLALDETQYFLLQQWANGSFTNDPNFTPYPVNPLDMASIGNCVGLPMCPGIEVTWSLQNPNVYAAPFTIADMGGNYFATGLDPSRDECEGGGCQPGDLTKRMACPWQADFFQCTFQLINFTDPTVNKANIGGQMQPLPPTYYAYWWPPQSPWDVLVGELSVEGQSASHNPAGVQVNYARGINSFVQMVEHWSALGFIRDQNAGTPGFPYLVETERVNELFTFVDVPVGQISGNSQDNATTIPVYFIQENTEVLKQKSLRAEKLVAHLEAKAFKPIVVAGDGLPLPRSGSRNRR